MIYVDTLVEYPHECFDHRRWAHLWTDGDIEELHEFAARIGLRRQWFQQHHTLPHYDVTPSKRAMALEAGAV